MKIVIDIPDNLYATITADEYGVHQCRIYDIIRNGTPLPKGHGRLKDIDWIDDYCQDYRTDDDGSYCFKWEDIDNAPTIIEADKESD